MGLVCGWGHTIPLEERPVEGSYGGKSGYIGYLRDGVIFMFQHMYRVCQAQRVDVVAKIHADTGAEEMGD